MSLINDALKRAKEAQQNAPAAPGSDLHLRAADPVQKQGWGLVFPATLVTILIAGMFSWWEWNRYSMEPGEVSSPADISARASAVPSTPAGNQPAAASPARADNLTPVPAAAAPISAGVPTNANSPVLPPPVPPAPRLQAVLFSPSRPSAIISGKTVFVGDRIGAFRVTAIGPQSATLSSGTETNVLVLE